MTRLPVSPKSSECDIKICGQISYLRLESDVTKLSRSVELGCLPLIDAVGSILPIDTVGQ